MAKIKRCRNCKRPVQQTVNDAGYCKRCITEALEDAKNG